MSRRFKEYKKQECRLRKKKVSKTIKNKRLELLRNDDGSAHDII